MKTGIIWTLGVLLSFSSFAKTQLIAISKKNEAKLIQKSIKRRLCSARRVVLAMQDLTHAVSDVLLIGKNVGKDILNRPFPGYALECHPTRVADAIQEQLKLIALLQQP